MFYVYKYCVSFTVQFLGVGNAGDQYIVLRISASAMEVIKIVLFVYAFVSSVFSSESTRRLYYEPTLSNDNGCICYPRNELYMSVSELLGEQNYGLERLVIYFYKDLNTNEIKMYTPNSRKQRLIPDLPYEIGDSLSTVNEELAIDIFYRNPHRVVINNVHHKIGAYNPHKNVLDEEHQTIRDKTDPNTIILHEMHQNIGDDIPSTIVLHEMHHKIRDNTEGMPIGMETGHIEEHYHEGVAHMPAIVIDATPQDDLVVNAVEYNNVWTEVNSANPHVNMYKYPILKPWHIDVQNEKWQGNIHNFFYPGKYWDINTQMPQEHNVVEIHPESTNHHYFNPKGYMPNMEDLTPDIGKKQYLTFDQWFMKQMRRFDYVNLPSDIDSINTKAFRTLIQKTLIENDMYVSTDGLLTDSQGVALDVSNLELRPVLLGNPVESQKVLNGGSIDLKLPKHLPYLEGMMITRVYPPRVLGIIPLGKTTLSKVSGTKSHKQTSGKNTAVPETNNLVGDLSHKVILEKDMKARLIKDLPSKMHKESVVASKKVKHPVIKHEYVSPKMENGKQVQKTHSTLKSTAGDVNAKNKVEPAESESRRLMAGDILKKRYHMLSDSKGGYVDYASDDDYEPYYKELPDFRIIGGNAATSSGAPVSNKGRSGYNN